MKNEVFERKLFRLFDYQRFQKNKELQNQINEITNKYKEEQSIPDNLLNYAYGGKRETEENPDKLIEESKRPK